MEHIIKIKKTSGMGERTKKKYLFVYGLLAYPLLNFIVFYVIINFDSVIMTFQKTDTETFKAVWVGFDNYKRVWSALFESKELLGYFWNSIWFWVTSLVIGMPLNLLFAYLMICPIRGGKLFRFCIMIPSMISGLVTAMIFSKMAENALPILLEKWFNIETVSLLMDQRFNMVTLLIYTLLTGFSFNIILYMNAMKGQNESLFEVAKLEGATHMEIFRYVCFPAVYSIMETMIVTSLPGLLAGDPGLFMFYQYGAPENIRTMGYYMFIITKNSTASAIDYSFSATLGMIITLITFPITLLVRRWMDRLDPNNE